MIVSLIILAALFGVGTILYIHYRLTPDAESQPASSDLTDNDASASSPEDGQCCGMDITCEKDSLLAAVSSEIVYYDDEELDAYRGRTSSQYSDEEIEQFRNVLLTLLPQDIAGWARSIQLRQITMPDIIRDELLMIIQEIREK